jgi:hypothetical protein
MFRWHRVDHRIASASAATALVIAVTGSAAASTVVSGAPVAVRCTETLANGDVTNGGMSGVGRCTLTGAIDDRGKTTDYRRQVGDKALIRRVVAGRKGTITFLITIHLGTGAEPQWSVISGSGRYRGLRGKGREVVDDFSSTPATFVMKGTVSR